MMCFLFAVFLGCSRQPSPSVESISGKYVGVYKGAAIETFELRKDLTFLQELKLAGKVAYRNEGTWRVENEDVVFDKMYCAVEFGSDNVRVPKIGTNNVHGLWVALNGRSEIVFDVEHNYRIKKQ